MDKLSAPKSRRFGRLWRGSRFCLQNSENEAALLALLPQSVTLLFVAKHQTRLVVFFNSKSRLRVNKSETCCFEEIVFCFHLCEVYRFQNLVGLELQIKHNHTYWCRSENGEGFFSHSNKNLQYKFTIYTTDIVLNDTMRTLPQGAKCYDHSVGSPKLRRFTNEL